MKTYTLPKPITDRYYEHYIVNEFISKVNNNEKNKFHLKGLIGSSSVFVLNKLYTETKQTTICILPDKEEAAYYYNDLLNYHNKDKVLFFPSSYKRSVQYDQIDTTNIVLRIEVLNKIIVKKNDLIIISYPEAIIEKVIEKQNLKKNTLDLKTGEKISLEFLNEVLYEYEFERVDFVYEPGQYAIRGSIVDIFSFSNDLPYRIDFFDDEVDSIRTFSIESQISIEKLRKISIIPNIQEKLQDEKRTSFFNFISKNSFVWIKDTKYCFEQIKKLYTHTKERLSDNEQKLSAANLLINHTELSESLNNFTVFELSNQAYFSNNQYSFDFNITKQPAFNKNFDLLIQDLITKSNDGFEIFIYSENEKQIERLKAIFEDKEQNIQFTPVIQSLHEGFIDHDLRICCYTDHQIFDRYHRFKLKENFNKKAIVTLNEINSLHPGDYIVHIDHGIGIFGGLEKIDINGKTQEAIKLVFKDLDTIYVNIHSLHRISKYKGKDGTPPKIYKLGSGAWQKLKQNTKKKVKDIAAELITLYAKRREQKGFSFSEDTYLNNELEASFIYEDTPDQAKSNKAVKKDMEADIPMDRLICGDVGFGKTEIAIRATFKAVCDNKQVAILVPTTILALQHFKTFSERLKDFPCTVDYISRLKSTKKQKEIIEDLQKGKLDILIGTHKLISKSIQFKDLGLLIIDEEQKFGVTVKEKLKQIKLNVDTLTLTATPIPRTLQFSLMGARDLSVMYTPPPNRHPIITEIHSFNEDIIKETINYEISRGGQVFFIHNRVLNILEVEAMINRLCPKVKTIVVHGQMEGRKLEKSMLDFIDGDFGVLIATSIIENGLDIPNVNTIIINNAQNFGLSDLHQLRGRVGRSNKKAFCYLLSPPVTALTPEAKRRLKAIEEYSELGSGFNIALQDLDIRGAGNLLGGEQSGFIADIGFETYHKILNEAIQELKEQEFKDIFSGNETQQETYPEEHKFVADCVVDTDLQIIFPEDYISNISERIKLYRQLNTVDTEENLLEFETTLIDRFGNIPTETKDLFNVVRLRWKAVELGFEKIILKKGIMICYFISNQTSNYYKSQTFTDILKYIQEKPKACIMKEQKEKLTISFQNITDIDTAILVLKKIM